MFVTVEVEGRPAQVAVARSPKGTWVSHRGQTFFIPKRTRATHGESTEAAENSILAPMTGRIVSVSVKALDHVEAGHTLLVMEAMKMEYRLTAPRACQIETVHAKAGDLVDLGALVVTLSA